MVAIVVVNGSGVLTDAEVSAVIPALQRYDDELLRPAWALEPATYSFMNWHQFPWDQYRADPTIFQPIFVNRHSTDPGALGFHEDQTELNRIFGRIFAGDCLRYGISWTVDLSHEAGEMRIDPQTNRTVTLPDGRIALVEVCDPVEDDLQAVTIDGVKLSNVVKPNYFFLSSVNPDVVSPTPLPGPWDYGGHLTGPCPTLTAGGYQELLENGQWTQEARRLSGGPWSYRTERWNAGSHRRRRIAVPMP